MIALVAMSLLLQCPAYAELPEPSAGLRHVYDNPGRPGPSLGIGERVDRVRRNNVESTQYIIPPGEHPIPGRRIVSAIGGLIILEITPVSGGSSRHQRVNERDIGRVAAMGPGEEVRFRQDFAGEVQEVTVTFQGCEQFEGEDVSVYRISSPEDQRTVSISHETGWWAKTTSQAGELVRVSRNF